MLSNKLMGASSAEKTYIEDVFSTYLYTGNGSTQTINNGIDLGGATGPWSLYSANVSTTSSGFHSLDVDSSGNMYVGISASGFGYFAKLSSTGSPLWSKSFTSATEFHGVKCDGSGNVYVTFITEPAGGRTPHILKYDSSGNLQWKRLVNPLSTIGNRQYAIDVDSSGNIISAGIGFQNGGAETPGQHILLNSSGASTWLKNVLGTGTYPHAAQYGAKFDSGGNIIFAGQFNNGTGRNNVSKYNTAGTILWNKILSFSVGSGTFIDVTVDASNNIYAAGDSNNKGLLCKFDSNGNLLWQLESSGTTFYSIALHPSGDLFVSNYQGDVLRVTSAGSIVWKVKFTATYGHYPLACTSTDLYVQIGSNSIAKLPVDGSATGGALNGVLLGASSITLSTASGTLSNVTYGSGNTLTMNTSAVVESSASVTLTPYNQPSKPASAGLVWIRNRNYADLHRLYDTQRGANSVLGTSQTISAQTTTNELTGFTSSGFSLGSDPSGTVNGGSNRNYVSWTFRKAPKFFDVVTYTGDGVAGRTIPHSLGVAPGMIIIKATNIASAWPVYHRSLTTGYQLSLQATDAAYTGNVDFNNSSHTSTTFTVGSSASANGNGNTYVAYLFAHDTDTDGLIQCGSFTTPAIAEATVTLGWEPQYVLIKKTSGTGDWFVCDNMRGMGAVNSGTAFVKPNLTDAEGTFTTAVTLTPTGFIANGSSFFGGSSSFIYMAIRRGPMKTPTDGTKVFSPIAFSGNGGSGSYTNSFPTDMIWHQTRNTAGLNNFDYDRLRGINRRLNLNTTDAEASAGFYTINTQQNLVSYSGNASGFNASGETYIDYNFRRAPGFFDVVCVSGDPTTVSHNLGVVPELIIGKQRNATYDWFGAVNLGGYVTNISVNSSAASWIDTGSLWNSFVTSSSFSTSRIKRRYNGGSSTSSSDTDVYYLFASCPGVSKVGSYTGNGSSQTINCGFTNGARFVLIKRTNAAGDWYVWDTARGIVAANDPHLSLNTTAAEVTTNDTIDPASSGFIVNQVAATNVNVTSATYIYLAIA